MKTINRKPLILTFLLIFLAIIPFIPKANALFPEEEFTFIDNVVFTEGSLNAGNLNSLKYDDGDTYDVKGTLHGSFYEFDIVFQFPVDIDTYGWEYYDIYMYLQIDASAQADAIDFEYNQSNSWTFYTSITNVAINVNTTYFENTAEFRILGSATNDKTISIDRLCVMIAHNNSIRYDNYNVLVFADSYAQYIGTHSGSVSDFQNVGSGIFSIYGDSYTRATSHSHTTIYGGSSGDLYWSAGVKKWEVTNDVPNINNYHGGGSGTGTWYSPPDWWVVADGIKWQRSEYYSYDGVWAEAWAHNKVLVRHRDYLQAIYSMTIRSKWDIMWDEHDNAGMWSGKSLYLYNYDTSSWDAIWGYEYNGGSQTYTWFINNVEDDQWYDLNMIDYVTMTPDPLDFAYLKKDGTDYKWEYKIRAYSGDNGAWIATSTDALVYTDYVHAQYRYGERFQHSFSNSLSYAEGYRWKVDYTKVGGSINFYDNIGTYIGGLGSGSFSGTIYLSTPTHDFGMINNYLDAVDFTAHNIICVKDSWGFGTEYVFGFPDYDLQNEIELVIGYKTTTIGSSPYQWRYHTASGGWGDWITLGFTSSYINYTYDLSGLTEKVDKIMIFEQESIYDQHLSKTIYIDFIAFRSQYTNSYPLITNIYTDPYSPIRLPIFDIYCDVEDRLVDGTIDKVMYRICNRTFNSSWDFMTYETGDTYKATAVDVSGYINGEYDLWIYANHTDGGGSFKQYEIELENDRPQINFTNIYNYMGIDYIYGLNINTSIVDPDADPIDTAQIKIYDDDPENPELDWTNMNQQGVSQYYNYTIDPIDFGNGIFSVVVRANDSVGYGANMTHIVIGLSTLNITLISPNTFIDRIGTQEIKCSIDSVGSVSSVVWEITNDTDDVSWKSLSYSGGFWEGSFSVEDYEYGDYYLILNGTDELGDSLLITDIELKPILIYNVLQSSIDYKSSDIVVKYVSDDSTKISANCSISHNSLIKERDFEINLPSNFGDAYNYYFLNDTSLFTPTTSNGSSTLWNLDNYLAQTLIKFTLDSPKIDNSLVEKQTTVIEMLFSISSKHDFTNVTISNRVIGTYFSKPELWEHKLYIYIGDEYFELNATDFKMIVDNFMTFEIYLDSISESQIINYKYVATQISTGRESAVISAGFILGFSTSAIATVMWVLFTAGSGDKSKRKYKETQWGKKKYILYTILVAGIGFAIGSIVGFFFV